MAERTKVKVETSGANTNQKFHEILQKYGGLDAKNSADAVQKAQSSIAPAAESMGVDPTKLKRKDVAEGFRTLADFSALQLEAERGNVQAAQEARNRLVKAAETPEQLSMGEALGLGLMQLAIVGVGAGVGYAAGGSEGAAYGAAIGADKGSQAAANTQGMLERQDAAINQQRAQKIDMAQGDVELATENYQKALDNAVDLEKENVKGTFGLQKEGLKQGGATLRKQAELEQKAALDQNINPVEASQIAKNLASKEKMLMEMEQTAKGANMPYTEFDKKLDKNAADIYNEWEFQGQREQYRKNRDQLQHSLTLLKSPQAITGPVIARLPDIVRAKFFDGSVDAEEAVAQVVQMDLRATLGAQFTQKEGEMLIARAYNPALPPEINIRRVQRLMNTVDAIAKNKDDLVDHLNQNRTTRGYVPPRKYTVDEIIEMSGLNEDGEGIGASGLTTSPIKQMSDDEMDAELLNHVLGQ